MNYSSRFAILTLFAFVTSCSQKTIHIPQEHIEQPTQKINSAKAQRPETEQTPEDLQQTKKTPAPKPSIVTIDKNGRLIVNGKPFFVIGLYSVPERNIPHAKALGFNAVHTYLGEGTKNRFSKTAKTMAMQSYLSTVHENGLMAWVGLPRNAIANDFTPIVERYIEGLKNSAALMAWYLYDEPDCDNIPVANLEYVSTMLAVQDPNHPKLLVVCRADKKSQAYFSIPDIILTDFYPLGRPGARIGDVSKRIKTVKRKLNRKMPLWNVIQLHGKGPGGKGYGKKEPSFIELRNMVYQSVIAGAKGLLFFTYHGLQFKLYKSPRGLENIKKMTTELKKFTPIFLSSSIKPDFISINKKPSIRTRFFKLKDKYYLFAVNLSRKPVKMEIKFKKNPSLISEMSNSRIIKSNSRKLSEKISSLGVNIYEFAY